MKRIFAISVVTVLLLSLVLIPHPVSAVSHFLPYVWVDDDWQSGVPPYTEDTDGDEYFATIQAGIDAVTQSGTVNVTAGTYNENIVLSAKPSIKILGAGAAVTTIDGGENGSVVTGSIMNADSRIEGFTITGGVAPSPSHYGGGLYLENSAITIASCNITGNTASNGGGIFISDRQNQGLSPKIENCLIKNNSATAGGGIFIFSSPATAFSPLIMNSTIAGNTAGNGIYNIRGTTKITNTIIYGNTPGDVFNSEGTSSYITSLVGTDPLFVGSGDYHLKKPSPPAISPAIDKGTSTGAPGNDLDGVSRPQGAGVDIGAFEFLLAVVNYTLNVTTVGSGDVSADPPGLTYPSSTSVELTASADPGWSFAGWSGDYSGVGTLTMDSDKNVTATFTQDQYTLTVSTVGSGTVALSPPGPTYLSGTEVTLTPNPASGWSFADWSGDVPGTGNKITMDNNKNVTANFVDKTPPEISVSVSPDTLWPPNHKMVEIIATVAVSDTGDPSPTIVLSSIVSNEPDDANGNGDGNTMNDIQSADIGTEDYVFLLRAERDGSGNGRIYTITYTAIDASGNSAIAILTVTVPHDLGKKAKK